MLAGFVVYATFRAFEGRTTRAGPYLSPLASPYFETKGLGIPFLTPAILDPALPRPLPLHLLLLPEGVLPLVRDDAAGAARSARRSPASYNGERKLLIFQNLHRFAMYFALLFLVFLWHDFIKSLTFDGHVAFGSARSSSLRTARSSRSTRRPATRSATSSAAA